jgi:hypothetical protein
VQKGLQRRRPRSATEAATGAELHHQLRSLPIPSASSPERIAIRMTDGVEGAHGAHAACLPGAHLPPAREQTQLATVCRTVGGGTSAARGTRALRNVVNMCAGTAAALARMRRHAAQSACNLRKKAHLSSLVLHVQSARCDADIRCSWHLPARSGRRMHGHRRCGNCWGEKQIHWVMSLSPTVVARASHCGLATSEGAAHSNPGG